MSDDTLDTLASLVPDKVTQSDIPERIAAGVEGVGRGILPRGVFDTVEHVLGGGGPEVEARAQKYSGTAKTTEMVGTMARDAMVLSAAGPLGAYGLAAANTIGAISNDAVLNHDSNLTAEHIAGTVFGELASAALNQAAGPILSKARSYAAPVLSRAASAAAPIFNRAGNAIMDFGENVAGKAVKDAAKRMGDAVTKSAYGLNVEEVAEKALKEGAFAKARAKGIVNATSELEDIHGSMETLLSQPNNFATASPPQDVKALRETFANTLQERINEMSVTAKRKFTEDSPAALTKLETLRTQMLDGKGPLTPTDTLDFEMALKNAASGVSGAEKRAMLGAHAGVKDVNDKFLAGLGVMPHVVRDLQQKAAVQQALIDSMPTDSLKDAGLAAVHSAKSAAMGAAVGGVAQMAGLSHGALSGGLGMLGFAALHNSGAEAKAIYSGLKTAAGNASIQGTYDLGKAAAGAGANVLKQFDQEFFNQYFANQVGNSLVKGSYDALRVASTKPPTKSYDHAFEQVQSMAQDPAKYRAQVNKRLADMPLSDAQKQAVADHAQSILVGMQKALPPSNQQFAPPGARTTTPRRMRDFNDSMHVATSPQDVVRNPTVKHVQLLSAIHPAHYSTAVSSTANGAAPNIGGNGAARHILSLYGFDHSVHQAAQAAQKNYSPPPNQSQGAGPKRLTQTQASSMNIHLDAATGIDSIEKGR